MSAKKSTGGRRGATRKPRTMQVVEDDSAVAAEPAEATKPKRGRKTPSGESDKKLSAINAAVLVLKESGEPMNAKQLIDAMTDKGYWTSPGGKTPHATLFSAIQREIDKKGTDSRFAKAERGKFTLASQGADA